MGKIDGPFFLPGPSISFRTVCCVVLNGMNAPLKMIKTSVKRSGNGKVSFSVQNKQ